MHTIYLDTHTCMCVHVCDVVRRRVIDMEASLAVSYRFLFSRQAVS